MGGGRASQEFGKQACYHGFHPWSLTAWLRPPGVALKVIMYINVLDGSPNVFEEWGGVNTLPSFTQVPSANRGTFQYVSN